MIPTILDIHLILHFKSLKIRIYWFLLWPPSCLRCEASYPTFLPLQSLSLSSWLSILSRLTVSFFKAVEGLAKFGFFPSCHVKSMFFTFSLAFLCLLFSLGLQSQICPIYVITYSRRLKSWQANGSVKTTRLKVDSQPTVLDKILLLVVLPDQRQ